MGAWPLADPGEGRDVPVGLFHTGSVKTPVPGGWSSELLLCLDSVFPSEEAFREVYPWDETGITYARDSGYVLDTVYLVRPPGSFGDDALRAVRGGDPVLRQSPAVHRSGREPRQVCDCRLCVRRMTESRR